VITLIFDGDCGFCTTSANFIVKESKPKVTAIPYQWAALQKFGLTIQETEKKVYLNVSGKNYSGHKAVAKLLRMQPNYFLKVLGTLAVVPPFTWVGAGIYWLTAKYRHKLPGGTPACKLER
jgi:predicted DCC family thiol-disulfide oxidoreductase YuxK